MRKFLLPFCLAAFPFWVFAQNSVVVSQVQIEGYEEANDEFVEIYNPTEVCVILDGWSLQYKSSTGDFPLTSANKKTLPKIILPPQAYYLVVGPKYDAAPAADLTNLTFLLSGRATGATVFLASSSQAIAGVEDVAIVDRFAYGNSASNTPLGDAPLVPEAAEKPAVDWAYVRTGFADDNAVDFSVQAASPHSLSSFTGSACEVATTTPENATTTGETLATTTPATETASSTSKNLNIKIHRFLPDPAGDDSGKEWIELKNYGTQDAVLDGWLLDDKNTGSGPGTDALVLSGTISAGEVKRFIIPLSHFALNNTGGDEVNLYFSDKTLADSAVYSASAYSDGIFEFVNGAWQPPVQTTGSSGGSSGGGSTQVTAYFGPINLKINEIFPNPPGDDGGSEWVEIYNQSMATTSLEGFFLGVGESSAWSSGVYELPKLLVPSYGFIQVVLPKGSISLKNSGKEQAKLFSPAKDLVDSVEYADAPENRSWQKTQVNTWEWNLPTPGEANIIPDAAKIIFSEILPSPNADQDEFIELYNLATSTVNLKGFSLDIGTRTKTFFETDIILSESYLTLFADDLPVALRNSGQEIVLRDNWDRLVAKVKYPPAQKGSSFASLDGKEFLWTASITPNTANQMVLGESLKVETKNPVSTSALTKKTTTKLAQGVDTKTAEALMLKNEGLSLQLAALQETVDELNKKLDNLPENKQSAPQMSIWWEGSKYLVLASVCGIFLFWLLKFLSQGPKGNGKL